MYKVRLVRKSSLMAIKNDSSDATPRSAHDTARREATAAAHHPRPDVSGLSFNIHQLSRDGTAVPRWLFLC